MSCNRCGALPLSGRVIGVGGRPVSDLPIQYSTGCRTCTTRTDSHGRYALNVRQGCPVCIRPETGLGVRVTPEFIRICRVCRGCSDLDFIITPVIAE